MVHPLVLLLAGALFITSAHAELLLSPIVSEYELDGVRLKQLSFEDGATTVTYQAPHGWTVQGSSTRLTLRPPNKPQVEATITRIPSEELGSLDEEGVKNLLAEAIASVPEDSAEITVMSQEMNPLQIAGKGTFLVTLRYTLHALEYCRSILFLNRADDQIRLQLTSPSADFQDLQRAFMASQYSWQNL